MKNEVKIGRFTVAGQPTDEELQELPKRGIGLVVNVRPNEELEEPEEPKVHAAGIDYANVPFTIETVTPDHVARVREAADRAVGSTVLVH